MIKLFRAFKPFSGVDFESDLEAFADALGVVDDTPIPVVDERFKGYIREFLPSEIYDQTFYAFQKATWPQEAPPLTKKERRLLVQAIKEVVKRWKASQS